MEEKKIVAAYVVERYEDGGVDVKNADVEGAQTLENEQIYKDIEDVAKIIQLKRTENAAYAGVARFYRDIQAAQESAAADKAE